jgi:hypothetical protein
MFFKMLRCTVLGKTCMCLVGLLCKACMPFFPSAIVILAVLHDVVPCGGAVIVDYLIRTFGDTYMAARQTPINDIRLMTSGCDPKQSIGRHLEFTGREDMLQVALYYMAKIEAIWRYGQGDRALHRSTALMSLIGSPGCGETAFIMHLFFLGTCALVRAIIQWMHFSFIRSW